MNIERFFSHPEAELIFRAPRSYQLAKRSSSNSSGLSHSYLTQAYPISAWMPSFLTTSSASGRLGDKKVTCQKEFEFMSVMLQVGRKPHPELPKVPLASEFAKTDEARQLIKIGIQDLSTLGHSYTLPPKTRKDRVATLRKAFEDTMRDPEFLAEAEKAKIIINPSPGGELEEIVSGFRKLSPEILTKLKSILLPKQ